MRGLLITLIILLFAGWIAAMFASGLGVFHIEERGSEAAICKGEKSHDCRAIDPSLASFLKTIGMVTDQV